MHTPTDIGVMNSQHMVYARSGCQRGLLIVQITQGSAVTQNKCLNINEVDK